MALESVLRAYHPKRPPIGFAKINQPLLQSLPLVCDHEGPCSSAACACLRNETTCRQACSCSNCDRIFPPCDCDYDCDESCLCVIWGRECVESCRNGGCTVSTCFHVFEGRPEPELQVMRSTIKDAGDGLFAEQPIGADEYIGDYRGVLVDDSVSNRDIGDTVSLFKIAKDGSIDGERGGSMCFNINHETPPKTNAWCTYIETQKGRKIIVLASRNIKKGEEIFMDYDARYDWEFPSKQSKISIYQYVYVVYESKLRIAKVLAMPEDGKVQTQLTYAPEDLPAHVRGHHTFGEHEILMTYESKESCVLTEDCIIKSVVVKEFCEDCNKSKDWCWNRLYNSTRGSTTLVSSVEDEKGKETRYVAERGAVGGVGGRHSPPAPAPVEVKGAASWSSTVQTQARREFQFVSPTTPLNIHPEPRYRNILPFPNTSVPTPTPIRSSTCSRCGFVATGRSALYILAQHQRDTGHSKSVFKCKYCGKPYYRFDFYLDHEKKCKK